MGRWSALNELQLNIYNSLMTLCDNDESFFYADQIIDSNTYRIFNYRLASYSQWLEPHATEARGITFRVDDTVESMALPLELVSWPFEKFFNLNENPFTMDVPFSRTVSITDKIDGSLISSMMVNDKLWLKSKGSLFSDQAQAANKLINDPEYLPLYNFVKEYTQYNNTVIMEYTAPDNRIVIGYEKPHLTVLAIRDNNSGNYVPLKEIVYLKENLEPYMVKDYIDEIDDVESFVNSIKDMEGIEGYVIKVYDQFIKIKTEWYLKLHHIKDSINSQRRLFEAVVYETTDDIRASFHDDPQAIERINEMEEKVSKIYHDMVHSVETFHKDNKHLERKEYAIKGQKELSKLHFGLAMRMYLGHDIDYRETMIKHRKDFGIKDDPDDLMEKIY